MDKIVKNNVDKIKKIILAVGFLECGELNINKLEYSKEIRKMCEDNVCRCYNTTWACPPAVGTIDECKKRVENYSHMILLSNSYKIKTPFDYKSMKKGMVNFKEKIYLLDDSLKKAISKYQILSNESCNICKECTYPKFPCRHKDKLFHSIEGYGFHIYKLAKDCNLKYDNGENTITYFGAVLFS